MRLRVQKLSLLFWQMRPESLFFHSSYRVAMRVAEVMVCKSAFMGETGYYVCPRCHITLEREFMSFCDRCGQHLDWTDYKAARIIYPGAAK